MNSVLQKTSSIIKKLRKAAGLRQIDLAEAIQRSHRHMQKIEAGNIDLNVSSLKSIATALNIPTCFLVEDFCKSCGDSFEPTCFVELFKEIPMGILVTDLNDNLVFSNRPAQERLKFSQEGQFKIFDFFNESTGAQLKTLFRNAGNEGGSLILQSKNEAHGNHKVAWKSLKNRQGQIYARLFTFEIERNF